MSPVPPRYFPRRTRTRLGGRTTTGDRSNGPSSEGTTVTETRGFVMYVEKIMTLVYLMRKDVFLHTVTVVVFEGTKWDCRVRNN